MAPGPTGISMVVVRDIAGKWAEDLPWPLDKTAGKR